MRAVPSTPPAGLARGGYGRGFTHGWPQGGLLVEPEGLGAGIHPQGHYRKVGILA